MNEDVKNIYLGLSLFICCALIYFVLIPAAVVVPKSVVSLRMSPAFWPRIITVVIGLLGLSLASGSLLRRRAHAAAAVPKPAAGLGQYKRPALVMAGLVLYYVMIEPLGIVAASMLGFVLFCLIFGERQVKVLLPLTLLIPSGLYYFFVKVANVPLPVGFWENFF